MMWYVELDSASISGNLQLLHNRQQTVKRQVFDQLTLTPLDDLSAHSQVIIGKQHMKYVFLGKNITFRNMELKERSRQFQENVISFLSSQKPPLLMLSKQSDSIRTSVSLVRYFQPLILRNTVKKTSSGQVQLSFQENAADESTSLGLDLLTSIQVLNKI